MAIALVLFLVTLIVGPRMFRFLSVVYHKHTHQLRFPTSAKGAIGDTLMLPLFNARMAYNVVTGTPDWSSVTMYLGATVTIVLAVIYIYYRQYIVPKLYERTKENWMNAESTLFNTLGWYHFGYFVVQAFVVVISLYLFPFDVWLCLAFSGYLMTAIVGHYQLKRWFYLYTSSMRPCFLLLRRLTILYRYIYFGI